MSMREFKRCGEEDEDDSLKIELPEDFSDEEVAFAQELNSLFPVDKEVLPPFYVQTLLEADDPRYQPAEEHLAQKTYVQVCRQLKLKRRIYHSQTPPRRTRRTFQTMTVLCLLVMFLSMIVTAPSFASGLKYIFVGHTGVNEVHTYPEGATNRTTNKYEGSQRAQAQEKVTMARAAAIMSFPPYMPDTMTTLYNPKYVLSRTSLYSLQDAQMQRVIDGPILSLQYEYRAPGPGPRGTGMITINEFKTTGGKVAQAVQLGSVSDIQIKIGEDGHISGLLIDGQWKRTKQAKHVWENDMVDLIFERNGVIFWITGDPLDGVNGETLSKIAASLQPLEKKMLQSLNHMVNHTADDADWQFFGPVIYAETDDGPVLTIVPEGKSQDQPSRGRTAFQG